MKRPRLIVGSALLGLSLVPWIVSPFVPFLGMRAELAGTVIGGLIISAELVGALAVWVLGREAYQAIRQRLRDCEWMRPPWRT